MKKEVWKRESGGGEGRGRNDELSPMFEVKAIQIVNKEGKAREEREEKDNIIKLPTQSKEDLPLSRFFFLIFIA